MKGKILTDKIPPAKFQDKTPPAKFQDTTVEKSTKKKKAVTNTRNLIL